MPEEELLEEEPGFGSDLDLDEALLDDPDAMKFAVEEEENTDESFDKDR